MKILLTGINRILDYTKNSDINRIRKGECKIGWKLWVDSQQGDQLFYSLYKENNFRVSYLKINSDFEKKNEWRR